MFYHSCSNRSFRWKVLLYVCSRHGVVIRLSLEPGLNARNCWVLLEKTPSLGVINVRGLFINRWWNNNWDLSPTVHRLVSLSAPDEISAAHLCRIPTKQINYPAATHCYPLLPTDPGGPLTNSGPPPWQSGGSGFWGGGVSRHTVLGL